MSDIGTGRIVSELLIIKQCTGSNVIGAEEMLLALQRCCRTEGGIRLRNDEEEKILETQANIIQAMQVAISDSSECKDVIIASEGSIKIPPLFEELFSSQTPLPKKEVTPLKHLRDRPQKRSYWGVETPPLPTRKVLVRPAGCFAFSPTSPTRKQRCTTFLPRTRMLKEPIVPSCDSLASLWCSPSTVSSIQMTDPPDSNSSIFLFREILKRECRE